MDKEDIDKIYTRSKALVGKDNMNILKSSHVLICGIGGVGSYTFESLVRMGVGRISIIDKDVVDISNINRQLIADTTNVGISKVVVAKEKAYKLNPEVIVDIYEENITEDNFKQLLKNIYEKQSLDYVVDAIDYVEGKIKIIQECKNMNIKVISSMGMANKLNPLDIKVADIEKTTVCPLAKIVRKKLKEANITKVKVVYSTESSIKTEDKVLGSVPFVPSVAGLVISSEVVKDILRK